MHKARLLPYINKRHNMKGKKAEIRHLDSKHAVKRQKKNPYENSTKFFCLLFRKQFFRSFNLRNILIDNGK